MKTQKRRRPWLAGLAIGIFLALLIAPSTRWLVKAQLALQTMSFPSIIGDMGEGSVFIDLFKNAFSPILKPFEETLICRAVERNREDYQIQLAYTLVESAKADPQATSARMPSTNALCQLALRFPENASVYANILRQACREGMRLARDEDYLISNSPVLEDRIVLPPSQAMRVLFDEAAAKGERLDPDNAFFPLMRAAGFFAAHRDEEGMEAIFRASRKSRWEDYYLDELEGKWRIMEEAFGKRSAIERMVVEAGILFPHYAPIRSSARVAVYKAIQAEKKGRLEEGLKIRHALMKCCALMRVEARSLIGALVGIAISWIATTRPGGEEPLKFPEDSRLTGDERAQMKVDGYFAYLRRIGHADEARWAQEQIEAGKQARAATKDTYDLSPAGGRPFFRLVLRWLCNLLLLSNVIWMLVLSGIAAFLWRNPRIRSGKPLPGYAQWGIASALIVSLNVGWIYPVDWNAFWNAYGMFYTIFGLMLMAILISLSLAYKWYALRKHGLARGLGVFLLTIISLMLLFLLLRWQGEGIYKLISLWSHMMQEGPTSLMDVLKDVTLEEWLMLAPQTGVPLLTILVLSIVSLIRRRPLSFSITQGFRRAGVPIACVLLMVYAGMILTTLRLEVYVDNGIVQSAQHEGRYLASLSGKEWPE